MPIQTSAFPSAAYLPSRGKSLFLLISLGGVLGAFGQARPSPAPELPLSPTPLMGWSSWNHYGKNVTEKDVRANADALVSSGLADLGYKFVNVDDVEIRERQPNAAPTGQPTEFTDMKKLGDYLHAKGLKFGVYSSPGPLTCAKYRGSFGREDEDARMFASWGADYLKYDLCTFRQTMNSAAQKGGHAAAVREEIDAYERMHQALLKTHRPIYFALCQYGLDEVWTWAARVGATMYRTTGDVRDKWESLEDVGFAQAGFARFVEPGHFIDPDSLEIGNHGMNREQYRVQMSLWSIVAAPLILGNDLTHMDNETLSIIGNKEVIAVDQDSLAKAGDRVWATGQLELWARPLSGGRMAVALFNRDQGITTMRFKLSDIGWTGPAKARDVWTHADLPVITDRFSADVPQHGVVMLVLQK